MNKLVKRMLVLVLILSMVLPNMAFAGLKPGADKAKVELVYMEAPSTNAKATEKEAKTEGWNVGDTFMVGVKITGLENIAEAADGLYQFGMSIVYDQTVLKAEPTLPMVNKATLTGKWTARMKANDADHFDADPNLYMTPYTYGNAGSATDITSDISTVGTSRISFMIQDSLSAGGMNPKYTGGDPFYAAIIEFSVLDTSKTGKVLDIIQVPVNNTTVTSMGLGKNASSGKYEANSSVAEEKRLANVMDFDASKVNIFPAGQPTLGGSATIVNNDGTALGTTLVTGTTVKVDTSAVTVSDSSTPTFSYQWMRSGSTTPIGTGATYTTAAADVGKTISCVVTATGCKGSVTTAPTPAVTKPALSGTVSITGTPKYGEVLTAGISGGNSASAGTLTYAWKVGGTPVTTGANGNKYTIQKGDIGKTVTCEVSGANTSGAVPSSPTATVAKADLTVPSSVTLNAGTVKVGATGNDAKKTLSNTFAGVNGDTITYAVDVTFTNTSAATTTPAITVGTPSYKIGNADATQYYNITGFPTTATGEVKAKSLTGWTVTPPTKTSYEDGVAIDLTGLQITATYDDDSTDHPAPTSVKVNGTAITSGTTPAALAMNGKDIVVEYNGEIKNAGKLTVTPKTSEDVTVTNGTATKDYDGTPTVTWTAAPTFVKVSDGSAVTVTGATYAYADANAGTGKAITITGGVIDGTTTKINVTNANALTGDITAVKPAITFEKLAQNIGSVTEVVAKGAPASSKAGDTLVVEYEVVTTPENKGSPCTDADPTNHVHDGSCGYVAPTPAVKTWETWAVAEPILKALTDTTDINVRAYAPTTGTVNYLAGSDADATTGVLKLTKSSGGGGGAVSSNYTVTFNVGAYGTLDGDAKATVKRGETISGLPTVTPAAGYIFCGWTTDGKTVVDPTTVKINKSTTFTALFIAPYISGYPDSTFRPDAQVTRAEIASMLARLNKDFKADATYTGTATDVASGAWYSNYVNFGMSKGFITGHQDGRFAPDANITRGEFASMLARYMGLSNGTKQFTDTADHWANGAIAALADAGIVTGYNDGSFLPNGKLTRAEAVQMINTALKVQALSAEPYVEPTDVAAAHWAYNQILAAMNTDIKDIVR